LAALNNVVIAGGFKGEVMCINVDTQEVYYADYVTTSNNAITNYIQLVPYKSHYPLDASPETEMLSIISQNDNFVRIFEVPSFKIVRQYEYPWAVNHATLSPCGKLMCVAGDDDNPLIINSETGKLVASLKGHVDFPFATAWHPIDHYTVATGAQDKTTRIWDLRMFKTVHCLSGRMGSVRSLKYSHDGTMLAAAECADFVHIYDTKSGYDREQLLDMFGEISGISFTPESDHFYMGIYDRAYRSLAEFSRVRHFDMIDNIIW
jgi:WD40 repeat protein